MATNNMGRPVRNKYKVGSATWSRWSNRTKATFNEMYYSMRPAMQFAYLHPSTPPMPRAQWATIRWNAAYEAAEIVNQQP